MKLCSCGPYIGLDGNPNERTPRTNPYSYELFETYSHERREDDEAVYSDRMRQWDYSKFNDCCMKVWGNTGQYFDGLKTSEEVELFLCLYFGEEVVLTAVFQGCNWSNGYPVWLFLYRKVG